MEVPNFMKDDNITQECKNLISSLPLDKDFLGKNNLCNYKGFWYHYNTLQGILNVENHFRPRDTDIIVASFPKTGTTWLKALTFALVERGKYNANPENHPLLSQNPHILVPFLEVDLYLERQNPDLTNHGSPRKMFGTHVPFFMLQESVKDSPCKIVYVSRNLKDAIVSDWIFRNKYMKSAMHGASFEVFFQSFCRGVNFFGPFWDHVLSYWKASLENPKHVIFMKYEDLKKEPRVQIKRLAEFLDCPFTEEEEESGLVDEILKLCSLRNLSNLEANKTGSICNLEFKDFFRKGEVGDWKNHLTSDMAKKIDDVMEEKLRGSGLKFE
ncbi:PREDICTED: cytosolic sulfotransferase 5-like [Tarenaya hassleriana]|uniref:cytosolic sulfotransferase 5-like n=1 Tax=Tarenaya hassleriana TaxID=28532 RepID=UPI00053C5503|nr:PREDICTED: cytosolic sulfotransferase 5-like [Tarenaya hassleriana]